jgi:AcrR family transcriptional regulator
MTRTVKEPDIRRAELLDAAQKLFYAKGYEKTPVQDNIDRVGVAKGTFYHYFGSKVELLDELVWSP